MNLAFNPMTQFVDRELVDGVSTWVVRDKPFAEQIDALSRHYEALLTEHLDAVAQSRRYDNRITCALRAGYPGPFQAECIAFAQWMDGCNALAYRALAAVQAGNGKMPESDEAFIAMLPVLVWPVSDG